MGTWKNFRRKPAQRPKQPANTRDVSPQPDPAETYSRKLEQIPERFTSVPDGYVVEHLNWEEYKDSGLPGAMDFSEVMSPKDLQKIWFDVLRDPDGNIVAERDQSGGRWWTPEELEAQRRASDEYEDQL